MTKREKHRIRVSVHEAGHAVIAHSLGLKVSRISIRRKGTRMGHCFFFMHSMSVHKPVKVALAGWHAEFRFGVAVDDGGSQHDLMIASRLLGVSLGRGWLKKFQERTKSTEKWLLRVMNDKRVTDRIRKVAEALMEHETLRGPQLKAALGRRIELV